jgi:hypothetical protein
MMKIHDSRYNIIADQLTRLEKAGLTRKYEFLHKFDHNNVVISVLFLFSNSLTISKGNLIRRGKLRNVLTSTCLLKTGQTHSSKFQEGGGAIPYV